MFRIAICDDDSAYLNIEAQKIRDVFLCNLNTDKILIESFTDGNILLNTHIEEPYDIALLDIDMPGVSGFDIASMFSACNYSTLIVFVTAFDELVYSSIKFQPYRFLRKTHFDEELQECLVSAYTDRMKHKTVQKLMFHTSNGDVYVDIDKVVFFEIYNHTLEIHLNGDRIISCTGNLKDVENKVLSYDFVRIHKSYLVNCNYIFVIGSKDIQLDDGTILPLSRYKMEAVRKKYMDFLRKI